MPFIKITDDTDHVVYVNVSHIATVEQDGDTTRIDLATDVEGHDKYIVTRTPAEQVMKLVADAS